MMEGEEQESSSLSAQQIFVLSVLVGRLHIVVCFFTRLAEMLVPQVGVSELSQIHWKHVCSERSSSRCSVCVCCFRDGIESSIFTYNLS